MDLSLIAEEYSPSIDQNGFYIDAAPMGSSDMRWRCPCSLREYSRDSLRNHFHTNRHAAWIEQLNRKKDHTSEEVKQLKLELREKNILLQQISTRLNRYETILGNFAKSVGYISFQEANQKDEQIAQLTSELNRKASEVNTDLLDLLGYA